MSLFLSHYLLGLGRLENQNKKKIFNFTTTCNSYWWWSKQQIDFNCFGRKGGGDYWNICMMGQAGIEEHGFNVSSYFII